MPAQDLPVLSPDKAVKTGVLPNGTSYYIVANPALKGVADFALVQKAGTDNISDTASYRTLTVARDALSVLPRCGGRSVQEFFTSHGVTPGKDGFVRVTDNATEFRFNNALLSRPEVLDSALLVLLDVADRANQSGDPFVRKWYSPSDQAVIVAGDIDTAAVEDKLKMLSYMTPSSPSSPRKEYVWKDRDTAIYRNVPPACDGISSFDAVWHSARIPREYMNTVQPAIYKLFLAELEMMAEEYVSDALRECGIPVARVSCSHRTSVQSSDDEAFSISVEVAEGDFPEAVRTVAGVMGGIDAGNADVRDLIRYKRVFLDRTMDEAFVSAATNSEYVDRCVAAFVYNGSLSTLQTKVDFLSGRVLADSTELRLFNNISSALLDPERNLDVTYSHTMHADSVRAIFAEGWNAGYASADDMGQDVPGDCPLFVYAGPKVKVKSEKIDHMSKGTEWTFANGFKVVYRRMPTGGKLHYTLALNGGFSGVENLEKGEGGYVSDYFMLSRIMDRPAHDFMAFLASEGMSMDVYTGLNATMISGSADDGKADFMVRALMTAVNCWEIDDEAVRYYESCEPLRNATRKGSSTEMVMKVNDIMCPDYRYVSYKMSDKLSPDLAARTAELYENLFRKTNDGVLILLGDMDPVLLKKIMIAYVGGFSTTQRAFRRPLVRYQPASGWSTYTVSGDRNSVDIALSVPLTLTAENFMAVEIASMVLKKNLSEALVDSGMYLDISHECRIYPNERVNFHIAMNEAAPDGFSSGMQHTGPIDALATVRSVLSGVGDMYVDKEDVEVFKVRLKAALDIEMKKPFYWLNVISRRHLAGKDFTTNHEARIESVNVEKVKSILSSLNEGTRVEYIVSKK